MASAALYYCPVIPDSPYLPYKANSLHPHIRAGFAAPHPITHIKAKKEEPMKNQTPIFPISSKLAWRLFNELAADCINADISVKDAEKARPLIKRAAKAGLSAPSQHNATQDAAEALEEILLAAGFVFTPVLGCFTKDYAPGTRHLRLFHNEQNHSILSLNEGPKEIEYIELADIAQELPMQAQRLSTLLH